MSQDLRKIGIPISLIKSNAISPYAILLLMRFKLYADENGFIDKSAKELGFPRSTLNLMVGKLKTFGFIEIYPSKGKNFANLYKLLK